jgi:polygalacturonase
VDRRARTPVAAGRRALVGGLAAGAGLVLLPGRSRAAAAFDVKRFGAAGDGKTPATRAIQKAIDACAAAGGGTVHVPAGRFLCGALFLRSNLHLELAPGAVLAASQRFHDFPAIDGRWEGIERKTHASLINGTNLENVSLTGGGLLDGQGWPWWTAHDETKKLRLERGLPREAENPPGSPLQWPRPRLVNLLRCQNVAIRGISTREAPSYNLHLVYCQDVVVDGVTLLGLETQNSDGVVIDSCKRVRVSNCSIGSGGEAIAIKSGYNEDGRRVGLASEDILVSNCNLQFSHGACVAVGSETAAGVRNVLVSNCTASQARYGVHIRSPRGRGGVVEGIRVSNMTFDKIRESGVMISHFFDSVRMDGLFGEGQSAPGNPETDRNVAPPVGEGTPRFRDFDFTGLTMNDVGDVAVIEGLPERFIAGVKLRDVRVTAAGGGIICRRAANIVLADVTMNAIVHPAVAARDVQGMEIHRLRAARGRAAPPLVELEHVEGALIHGCAARDSEDLVKLRGSRNRRISLEGNVFSQAAAAPYSTASGSRRSETGPSSPEGKGAQAEGSKGR